MVRAGKQSSTGRDARQRRGGHLPVVARGPERLALHRREARRIENYEIEQRAGRTVSAGAIYTGFERLTGKGLVTSTFGPPSPQRGGKRRRLYTLEPAGAEALERAWAAIDRMAEGMAAKLRVFGG